MNALAASPSPPNYVSMASVQARMVSRISGAECAKGLRAVKRKTSLGVGGDAAGAFAVKVSKAGTAAEAGPDSANVPLRSEITGGFLLGRLALLYLAKPFLMPILIVLVLMILRQPARSRSPCR